MIKTHPIAESQPLLLVQVLALVAMEKPVSLAADDIRDEKVKVLRCLRPISPEETVLGQYTAAQGEPGYLEDEGVPKDSKCPTFAASVLHIDNDRRAIGPDLVLRARVFCVPCPCIGLASIAGTPFGDKQAVCTLSYPYLKQHCGVQVVRRAVCDEGGQGAERAQGGGARAVQAPGRTDPRQAAGDDAERARGA